MCIAILKKQGTKISRAELLASFERNAHGAGFAFVNDKNEIEINKGFFDGDKFADAVEALGDKEALLHCRLKTHGAQDKDNCHPFFIESDGFPQYKFAIAHNGQLPWRSTAKESDTQCFVNEFIKPIIDRDPFFFGAKEGMMLMESFIGTGNKLIVMRLNTDTNECDTYIVNERLGNWKDGSWRSNYSYLGDKFCRRTGNMMFSGNYYGHQDEWDDRHYYNQGHNCRVPARTPMLPTPPDPVGEKGGAKGGDPFADVGRKISGSALYNLQSLQHQDFDNFDAFAKGGWFINEELVWVNNHPEYKGPEKAKKSDRPYKIVTTPKINSAQLDAAEKSCQSIISGLSESERKLLMDGISEFCKEALAGSKGMNIATKLAITIMMIREEVPMFRTRSDKEITDFVINSQVAYSY